MYRLLIICLFSILLFLFSCDSVKPEEPDTQEEPFSIEISLTDSNSNPLSGYRVSIFQKGYKNFTLEPYSGWGATSISWSNIRAYNVEVFVKDYFENIVRTLVHEVKPAGLHTVIWDAKDDTGRKVRDGIYKIETNFYNEADSLVFTGSNLAYRLGEFMGGPSYITDRHGKVESQDIIPFPVLYCEEDIHLYNTNGEFVASKNFAFTYETMVVLISPPGEEESRQHFFEIKKGKNKLELNWDDMKYSDYDLKSGTGSSPAGSSDKNGTKDIGLSAFTAWVTAQNFVRLLWTTEYESGILGFRIYRAENANLEDAVMCSPLIEATNTNSSQAYVFDDREVETGKTYYYWLQALDLDGSFTYHGPIMIELEEPPLVNNILHNYPNPF